MSEYKSPSGRHRHKCPKCGVIWEHDAIPLRVAHTCLDCGGVTFEKYFGAEKPKYHDPGKKTMTHPCG